MHKKVIDFPEKITVTNEKRWYLDLAGTASYLLKNFIYEIPTEDKELYRGSKGLSLLLAATAKKAGVSGKVHCVHSPSHNAHFFFMTSTGFIIDLRPKENGMYGYDIYVSKEKEADDKYSYSIEIEKTTHGISKKDKRKIKSFVNKHKDDLILLKRNKPWKVWLNNVFKL